MRPSPLFDPDDWPLEEQVEYYETHFVGGVGNALEREIELWLDGAVGIALSAWARKVVIYAREIREQA